MTALGGAVVWDQYRPSGATLRVTETSCCAAFEWCCEGGLFFVLRRTRSGYEEAGRGRYSEARALWASLVREHGQRHLRAS